jgi:subfamily B ATP-binding cassette protein HlyB/CyaB
MSSTGANVATLPTTTATSEAPPRRDTGVACLAVLLTYLDRPVDPGQVRHQYGRDGAELSVTDILHCLKDLEIKARRISADRVRLADLPLPALAVGRDGGYFVIARDAGDKVLIHDPIAGRPVTLSDAELASRWTGDLILLATRETLAGDRRPFDVSWFIPAVVRFRRLFGEVLIASFFLQLVGLISPLFFQVVVDKVLVHRTYTTLDVLVLGLIVVTIFEVVLSGLRTYVFSHTTNRIDVELGAKLYRHLLALPLPWFQVRRVGQSVARVRELENIRQFLTSNALTLVIDLLFTVVFFTVMLLYSVKLTLIVLAAVPLFVGVVVFIAPALRRRLDEKFQRGAENQSFLVESVAGVETVKAMAVEPQMQRRWEEQLAGYVQASFKVATLATIGSHVIQLIAKLVTAATLWFGAQAVISGELTVGQFIAFNMFANHVIGPVLRLAQMWQDFQQVRLSVARLGDILNTPAEPSWKAGRVAPPPVKGDIAFESVTFRYRPDGAEVLRKVSFALPAGQVVGIVGASGSGKSTLTKLVQRLYVPESGRVLVDGTDLALIDPAWLRRQVGVVPQESVLFNRSIRDNIALTDRTQPMERVIAAAKLAGAHDFILQLPEGYETEVEERGMNLSGGQRQRIAIARALLSDPRVLIFDEATSALDAESEEIIQHNMRQIVRGRTVLIIAHRLSALRLCDRVISLDKGELVEDGAPRDLLKRDGPFARYYRKQIDALRPEDRRPLQPVPAATAAAGGAS